MVEVLYEDNHIIVCYKPKGILSQADGGNSQDMLTLVKEYIRDRYHKPGNVYLGLVHRLDRNTSGIMVFAKTSKAASRLSRQIQNHQFEKRYIAWVEGTLENKEYREVITYLEKNEGERKAYPSASGQEAVLRYRVLRNFCYEGIPATELEIELKTGRFHQIRAQMAAIGHPLLGDGKYGASPRPGLLMPLQAYSLSFYHPTTKEYLHFEKIV